MVTFIRLPDIQSDDNCHPSESAATILPTIPSTPPRYVPTWLNFESTEDFQRGHELDCPGWSGEVGIKQRQ